MKRATRFSILLSIIICAICLSACGGLQNYPYIYSKNYFYDDDMKIELKIKKAYSDPEGTTFNRQETLKEFKEIVDGMNGGSASYCATVYTAESETVTIDYLFIEKTENQILNYYLLADTKGDRLAKTGVNHYKFFGLRGRLSEKAMEPADETVFLIPFHLITGVGVFHMDMTLNFVYGTEYTTTGTYEEIKDFYSKLNRFSVAEQRNGVFRVSGIPDCLRSVDISVKDGKITFYSV